MFFSEAASSQNFTTQIEYGIALIMHDEFSHLPKARLILSMLIEKS